MGEVTDLDAFIPRKVRNAAQRAWLAKKRLERATAECAAAMLEFANACVEHKLSPADIIVGLQDGLSITPANHPASKMPMRAKER